MAKFKIVHNRDLCIGCGRCAQLCENWEMKDDGKAAPKKTEIKESGCNQEAADNCPVSCISVEKADE